MRRAERIIRRLHEQQIRLAGEVDDLRLAMRPEYPTPEMERGVREALAIIAAGNRVSESHHGTRTDEPGVWWHESGWMSVEHGAPYKAYHGHSGRLWCFSEHDVARLTALIAECGFAVDDHWQHSNGHSFRVVRALA